MKRIWIALLAVFMTAGMASAQIWSESFSTNAPPTLNTDSFAQITNEYTTGQWTTLGGTVDTNGQLRLIVSNWADQQGMTWGTSIALDDGLFTAAGNYRLTLDIAAMQADATLGVRVYDASIGSGGTNNYYQLNNYQYGLGTKAKVVPFGDATTNLLAEAFLGSAHKGIRSIDFAYDGSGDVVLMLMAMSSGATAQRWIEIDEISVDVATPNPDVPSFALDNYDMLPEALENEAYTNSTFLASITSNPGLEPLDFSVGKASWLTITDGTITGTPTVGGTNTFYISVADADGAYDDAVFTLLVTNANDAPVFTTAYGDNQFWAGNALANLPYSADLNGYVFDEDGDTLTFSGSGPAWLTVATDGILSGTPGDSDFGNNAWQIIVDDGTDSVTGTLHIAVQKKTIVHIEDFNTMATVPTANPSVFPTPQTITTTATDGSWYKGGTVVLDGGTLKFVRVAATGGLSASAVVFAEALFADGAGTYTLSFDIVSAGAVNKTYVELHDLDLSAGTVSVPTYKFAKSFEDPGGLLPAITATNGASASMITNVTYGVGALGVKKIEFEYDGSGDVLLRIGAGKNGSTEWWTNHKIDDLSIIGSSLATAYDLWAAGYGLSGAAAAATNDVEPDGVINLLEYAYNGDPTNAASKGTYPVMGATTFDGSTNWIEFIHVERTGDNNLTYTLEKKDDLVFDSWTNSTDAVVAGESPVVDNYKTVTNAVPTDGKTVEFLRVKVAEVALDI